MGIFLNLIRHDAFIPVNKNLLKLLGGDTTIFYCELATRYCYFEERNMLTEEGWFFNTVEDLEEATTLTEYMQRKAVKKLVEVGLIEIKSFGLPCRRYFRLITDDSQITQIIDQLGNKPLKNQSLKNLSTGDIKNLSTGGLVFSAHNNNNVITPSNNKKLITSLSKKIFLNDEQPNKVCKQTKRGCERELKETNRANEENEDSPTKTVKKSEVIPPTLTEITEFVSKKNFNIDCSDFLAYYSSHNWIDSKGRTIKWKQKLYAWNSAKSKKDSLAGDVAENSIKNDELKEFFIANFWERYPKQHRVGLKVCFSKFKSAIKNGSNKDEIMSGFETYLTVIRLHRGCEQYIKRLDNWFAAESWKNPNKYMKSEADKHIGKMERTMYQRSQNKNQYASIENLREAGWRV